MITLKLYIPHTEEATAIGICSELNFKNPHPKQEHSPPPSPFKLIRGGKILDVPDPDNQPKLRKVNDVSTGKVLLNYALALIEKAIHTKDGSIQQRDIEAAIKRLEVIL